MRRIAFLSAGCMFAGHPDFRPDHFEHNLEFDPIAEALGRLGFRLEPVVWDDSTVDLEAYEAFVVGTAWDYTTAPSRFVDRLGQISALRPVLNPPSTIAWNLDKTYLRDLEALGVPVVPTLFRTCADQAVAEEGFAHFDTDTLVFKPQIGASAWRQTIVRRGAPLPDPQKRPPGATLVQPFLHAAITEGEFSLLYFDRSFSHAVQKQPAAGDYRVQSMYGAKETAWRPDEAALSIAQRAVEAVAGPLLYARVDLMRRNEGDLAVMELELIEPYLYPEQGPGMGKAFAVALVKQLAEAQTL